MPRWKLKTMIIDQSLLDGLTAQAKASPRLRMNLDLRNSPADGSQRMLNALEPGTPLPIHRHLRSSETVVVLRDVAGKLFLLQRSGRHLLDEGMRQDALISYFLISVGKRTD